MMQQIETLIQSMRLIADGDQSASSNDKPLSGSIGLSIYGFEKFHECARWYSYQLASILWDLGPQDSSLRITLKEGNGDV